MLKGLSPLLSPELLATLYRMGHGEEIVLADAHFPTHEFNNHVIRADGLPIPALLEAILPLFELDAYDPTPVITMEAVGGDTLDPKVEGSYAEKIAMRKRRAVPDECFRDAGLMSKWISRNR